MTKRRKGELNVFSMSFLDAITAGFGCVVLLFMLVSANAVLEQRTVVEDREAEARRWELRVLTGQRNLVAAARAARARRSRQWTALLAMRQGLLTRDSGDASSQLATLTEDSEARQAAIERLRRELAELNRQSQELVTTQRDEAEDATSLRSFEGEGNRQYLTGLRMGGRHVVILVDTSTSMLDRTIVNILRRRNMSPEQQRRAPKWQQVVNTVDWLTTQIQPGTNVQVIGFNDKATWLIPGTEGQWVTVNDGSELDAPVEALRATHPQGPTSLHAAFNAIKTLEPKPDNIYLLDRRLADDGRRSCRRAPGVRAEERFDHFDRAIRQLPVGVPVNTHPVRDGRRPARGVGVLAPRDPHGRLDDGAVGGLAMRRRREFEIFSMSFLDAICCGFGAMILLFLLIRVGEPTEARAGRARSRRPDRPVRAGAQRDRRRDRARAPPGADRRPTSLRVDNETHRGSAGAARAHPRASARRRGPDARDRAEPPRVGEADA